MAQPRLSVAMLTFNIFKSQREQFFYRAWASLDDGEYPLTKRLITNGSTDGTQDLVASLGGIVDDTDTRICYGMQRGIEWAVTQGDIVLFSADDMTYKPGWARRLMAFWNDAPDEVAIATLFLEDCWPWNTVRGVLEAGGERALIRDSVPGGCWSFRAQDWLLIGPIPQVMPGEDHAIIQKLEAAGYIFAALDLAEHTGLEHSAWNNQSHTWSTPLDRARWGV